MTRMFRSFVCPALLASLVACSGGLDAPDAEVYQAEMAAWQDDYLQSLVQPDGWLTLVGLLWLQEGDNRFGSGEDVDLRLDHPDLPALAGVFELKAESVTFTAAEGTTFTSDGQPVTELAMDVDDLVGRTTVLRSGSLHLIVIERGGRYGLRIRDLENPARTEFAGLDFYPVDLEWRLIADFVPYEPTRMLQIMDVTGTTREFESPGVLRFEIHGRSYDLVTTEHFVTDELFIMFSDRTSGNATFGAGRYIYTSIPNEAGKVVLDFNRAYNPPCAYTRHAVCPLPPPENRLPIRVTAGERDFVGNGGH